MEENIIVTVPSVCLPDFLHQIIDQIRQAKVKPKHLTLEWSECNQIDSIALCLLINMCKECEVTGIQIHNLNSRNNSLFIDCVQPYLVLNHDQIEVSPDTVQIFMATVKDIQMALSRVELMKIYIATHPQLKNLNTSTIEIWFSELYMNVCQHSSLTNLENGVAMVAIRNETSTIELVVTDIGIGIPTNIKETFPDYVSKEDQYAIQYATEDLVTTKNTEQNYGRGLNTLITSIVALNGGLEILSGYGGMNVMAGEEKLFGLKTHHNGTQIKISVDFRNFENRSTLDFSEEINF